MIVEGKVDIFCHVSIFPKIMFSFIRMTLPLDSVVSSTKSESGLHRPATWPTLMEYRDLLVLPICGNTAGLIRCNFNANLS